MTSLGIRVCCRFALKAGRTLFYLTWGVVSLLLAKLALDFSYHVLSRSPLVMAGWHWFYQIIKGVF